MSILGQQSFRRTIPFPHYSLHHHDTLHLYDTVLTEVFGSREGDIWSWGVLHFQIPLWGAHIAALHIYIRKYSLIKIYNCFNANELRYKSYQILSRNIDCIPLRWHILDFFSQKYGELGVTWFPRKKKQPNTFCTDLTHWPPRNQLGTRCSSVIISL